MPVIIQANYPLRLSSSLSSLFKTYYNSLCVRVMAVPILRYKTRHHSKNVLKFVQTDYSIKQFRWYIAPKYYQCHMHQSTKTIIYRYWVSFLPVSHASFRSTTSFTCRKCLFGNWLAGRGLLCFRFIAIVKQILS